jgi:hypothetical protein
MRRRLFRHMSQEDNSQERNSTQAEQSSPDQAVDLATAAVEALPSNSADVKKAIVTEALRSLPSEATDAKSKLVTTALENLATEEQSDLSELVEPTTPPLIKDSKILLFGAIGGGLGFFLAALVAVFAIVLMTLNAAGEPLPAGRDPTTSTMEMVNQYLAVFFSHIILLITALLSAVIGYLLFRTAGAASREVIPWSDRKLLSSMLTAGNSAGIDEYVRLSSLSGTTGFFTKIGLSGLPLATIGLTLIFALLSIGGNANFAELAKLTLGAFLGSYVQRQVGQAPELQRPESATARSEQSDRKQTR